MTQTVALSALRARAVSALALRIERDTEAAKSRAEKELTERHSRLVKAIHSVLRPASEEFEDIVAGTDVEGRYVVIDGIYFQDATKYSAEYSHMAGTPQLNVYVDLQDDQGAVAHTIKNLEDLGSLFETYGDGNLVDVREYQRIHRLDDNDEVAESRLVQPAAATRLAADPRWVLDQEA